jgi:hypothetical protein
MNVLLVGGPQVLHTGNWLATLRTSYQGTGNELSRTKMAELTHTVSVKGLLGYRLAVGKRTREVIRRIRPEDLWARPALERLQRLSAETAVSEQADWLLRYWGGSPSANLLLMPATRHGFLHLNEIYRVRTRLRRAEEAT